MSEIRVTTLKDTAGGNASTSAQIYSGRAKAWVDFNGSGGVAIRANFNVNSITDNGTGSYTVNFTSSLPSSSYAMLVTGSSQAGSHSCTGQIQGTSGNVATNKSTTACQILMTNQQSSTIDPGVVCCSTFI